ncbi:uncharacterized protein LOC131022970 [Salvia miltiorrhiza]|uniref:uncharacterized protein LOC131022970 n=1 Tax=Salvia miltiorrhiza TaxID=226208 RepID=UPI0025AD88CF|nr:uncharacterized protein LOC131022970 [Salvia miltiorrhiza]
MSETESDYSREEEQPVERGHRPSTSRREKYPTPNPPPRHAWLRPCMQGYAGRINHYVKDTTLKEVETCLTHYQRLEQFKKGPFGHLLQLKRQDSANAALHHLLARELYDEAFGPWEKWFHVGGHDIRFGAVEYCLVTGLCFGPSPQRFDPNVDHRVGKQSLWHGVLKGKKVEVKDLRKRFVNRSLGNSAQDYLKAANILVAYDLLFCRDYKYVHDWVWALVEEDQKWSDFPWGSYSFQILCHGMSVLKKHPNEITGNRKTYHFYGPIWALQIWSYEAIPRLGRACGMRDTRLQMPRLVNWTTWKSASDFTHFFNAHEAECHRTLEPVEEENDSWYLQTLRHPEPFSVRYHPGGKYAGLTEPVVPEPPPPVRPPPVQRSISRAERTREKQPVPVPRSSSRAERAREKQPVHVERHRQTYVDPTGSPSKRPRPQEFDDSVPRADPDTDYWRRRDEDLIARVTESVTREQIRTVIPEVRRAIVDDDSEHGLVAKITRKVVAAVKDIFGGRSSSRKHRSSSSHASRHRHGSEELDQSRPSHRRSTSHIPSPGHRGHEDPPHVSHRHSVGDLDRQHRGHSQSQHGDDPPHASQRRSASRHSEREASMRRSASHHGERQTSLRRSASRHSERSARQRSPVTPMHGEGDDDVQFSWTTDEEEAQDVGRPRRPIKPSALLQSPYVTDGPLNTPTAKKVAFRKFREMGDDACVAVVETGYMMTQGFFGRILDRRAEFDAEIIDLWILKQNRRIRVNQEYIVHRARTQLQPGISRVRTPVAATDLYDTLYREYGKLHPEDPQGNHRPQRDAYTHWNVPYNLITMFQGTDADHTWHWLEANEILTICNVNASHWCTVVISIERWEVRVYDSLSHVEGITQRRQASMRCITRLMPRLLHTVGYWDNNPNRFVHAADAEMAFVMMPHNQQFMQQDSISCGVYACAYLDRLICGKPKRERMRTNRDVEKYRYMVAVRIWELCTPIPAALI